MFETLGGFMLAVIVIIVVALIVLGAALDFRARRKGHRPRQPGDIKAEMREQRLHLQARQSVEFRQTGDDATDASFSPDREQRLGR